MNQAPKSGMLEFSRTMLARAVAGSRRVSQQRSTGQDRVGKHGFEHLVSKICQSATELGEWPACFPPKNWVSNHPN